MLDQCIWIWWEEWIQAGKHAPGYYQGELPKPSKAVQISNSRTSQRYSSRRAIPRHIIVRFTRVEMKEKMLRAARQRGQFTHRGKPIRPTADLSAETLHTKRELGSIVNILIEKNFQPRISYSAKLSFVSEGDIKSSTDKQLLRDFCHHQTCPIRAPERNTKHRKKQVPVTAKANQLAKTKNEENESTKGKENQPVTKWQDQIHT